MVLDGSGRAVPGGQDQCDHRSERVAVQFDGGVDGLVGCDDVHGCGGDVEFGMDLRELEPSTSDQGTCPALLREVGGDTAAAAAGPCR